jgi:hypothetical protein
MNKTIKGLKAEIERRGGSIHIDGNLPGGIGETFLRQILACPDCAHEEAHEQQFPRH